MTLKHKLLLVGLVTLLLPWSAWQYLKQTEQYLRLAEERALTATASALARMLEERLAAEAPAESGLYVRPLRGPAAVDGYADDWAPWLADAQVFDDGRWRLSLAENADGLYLLLQIRDAAIRYAEPRGWRPGSGDYVLLNLPRDGADRRYAVATSAPGWVQALPLDGRAGEAPIRGEWQETADGYTVELHIPAALIGERLGIAVADDTGTALAVPAALPLVRPAAWAERWLAALSGDGGRLWLIGADGWVLARSGDLRAPVVQPEGRWLRNLVYRQLLAPPLADGQDRGEESLRLRGPELAAALAGDNATRWRPAQDQATVVAATAVPVRADGRVIGAVLVEQASDALLLLANQALLGLLGATVFAFGLALAVLFAFASRLSLRIRRLRDAAVRAVAPDGVVNTHFPEQQAADELGDLARSFSQVMAELRDYTDYLRSLADKLSHELRTPLAVVSSSLDNLHQSGVAAEGEVYLERARGGAERLSRILRAMSEASRLEQSLQREEVEPFDLRALVRGCVEGYRAVSPERPLELDVTPGDFRLQGAPELMAQLLDKLVDNALGFGPTGGWIRVSLRREAGAVELAVANQGPLLPERLQGRLFDSMVSLRGHDDGKPHLGLGLYVVRLIGEFHGGSVQARNRDAGDGVEFSLRLPAGGLAQAAP